MSELHRHRLTPADQYRRLWRGSRPPDLKAFVAEHATISLDDLQDLVEIDRTERWRRGDRVKAERYLKDFPPLRHDKEATFVIIYGEYFMRKDLGETPSLMDFIARFPTHAHRLRDQVNLHEALEQGHTPLGGPGPPDIPGLVVGELLGRGGMSTVYHATDIETGKLVAVKVLDSNQLQNILRVARFRREVNALMRLKHPHIVSAYRTDDARGLPYLVMEFCAAGPLSSFLRRNRLTPPVAADVVWNLARAVEYAHSEGVIHRDIKPANVLLSLARSDQAVPTSGSGEQPALVAGAFPFIPKLSDFGLAKCLVGTEVGLTATRESLGTPCYMAPELATGARDADARTDVYGLGALLYELLTARPPFVATSPMEVLRMVREEPPVPPTSLSPAVPDALQTVCLRCLEKDPAARYATAGEVATALDWAMGSQNL
jgi:hypothetical protein